MAAPTFTGGRREIAVTCPSCNHSSQIPPSAVARNSFFCGMCGKSMDLSNTFRQMLSNNNGPNFGARREKDNRYKSARRARR